MHVSCWKESSIFYSSLSLSPSHPSFTCYVVYRTYEPLALKWWDCDEFLSKQIRYQHLIPPTPDIDYIPLHVVIKDK